MMTMSAPRPVKTPPTELASRQPWAVLSNSGTAARSARGSAIDWDQRASRSRSPQLEGAVRGDVVKVSVGRQHREAMAQAQLR
jgi:hypothetical protein